MWIYSPIPCCEKQLTCFRPCCLICCKCIAWWLLSQGPELTYVSHPNIHCIGNTFLHHYWTKCKAGVGGCQVSQLGTNRLEIFVNVKARFLSLFVASIFIRTSCQAEEMYRDEGVRSSCQVCDLSDPLCLRCNRRSGPIPLGVPECLLEWLQTTQH